MQFFCDLISYRMKSQLPFIPFNLKKSISCIRYHNIGRRAIHAKGTGPVEEECTACPSPDPSESDPITKSQSRKKDRPINLSFIPTKVLLRDVPLWECPKYTENGHRFRDGQLEDSDVVNTKKNAVWERSVDLIKSLRQELPQMPHQHSLDFRTLSTLSNNSNIPVWNTTIKRLHRRGPEMSPADLVTFLDVLARHPCQTKRKDLFLVMSQIYKKSEYFSNGQVIDLLLNIGRCSRHVGLGSVLVPDALPTATNNSMDQKSTLCFSAQDERPIRNTFFPHLLPPVPLDTATTDIEHRNNNNLQSPEETDSRDSFNFIEDLDSDIFWDFVVLTENQWKSSVSRLVDQLFLSRLSHWYTRTSELDGRSNLRFTQSIDILKSLRDMKILSLRYFLAIFDICNLPIPLTEGSVWNFSGPDDFLTQLAEMYKVWIELLKPLEILKLPTSSDIVLQTTGIFNNCDIAIKSILWVNIYLERLLENCLRCNQNDADVLCSLLTSLTYLGHHWCIPRIEKDQTIPSGTSLLSWLIQQ